MSAGRNLVQSDWKKDIVYLVQFPRSGCIPSLSPFCLKTETFLRMADLPYQNVSNEFKRFSRKGKVPFVEVNGREIADSNFIMMELGDMFNKDIDGHLKSKDRADLRAYHSLVENSILWVGLYHRSKNCSFYATADGWGNDGELSSVKKFFFRNVILRQLKKKYAKMADMQGIGAHSLEEAEVLAKRDLSALSEFLGTKKFMFGDKPTTLDATTFGTLANMYYTPMYTDALKVFMREKTGNLIDYLDRVKTLYWPDWQDATRNLLLNTNYKDDKYKQLN